MQNLQKNSRKKWCPSFSLKIDQKLIFWWGNELVSFYSKKNNYFIGGVVGSGDMCGKLSFK